MRTEISDSILRKGILLNLSNLLKTLLDSVVKKWHFSKAGDQIILIKIRVTKFLKH